MKKFIFLPVLLCLLVNISFSQDELKKTEGLVKWSEVYKFVQFRVGAQLAGYDDKFVYIFQGSRKKMVMEKYDLTTFELTQSAPISLKYKDKWMFPKNYFMYDNKPAISGTVYNRKSKVFKTIVFLVDPKTLILSKPFEVKQSKKLENELTLSGSLFGSALDFLETQMFVSENKEFVFTQEIIYASNSSLASNPKVKSVRGKLFDKDLKLIVKTNYKFPQEIFKQVQIKVGNDGLVYIGGSPARKDIDLKSVFLGDTKVYESVEIYVIDLLTGNLKTITMNPEGREVKGFDFTVDNENNVTITGLTNLEDQGVSGSFFAKYDKDLNQIALNLYDFENGFLSTSWTDKIDDRIDKRNEKKNEKGKESSIQDFYRYKIHNLIEKPDGSVTFLAEQWYIKVIPAASSKSSDTYVYYFGDIISINYNKSGELVWKTIIDKSQVSYNDRGLYSSFSSVLDGNDISVFFNGGDEKKLASGETTNRNQMVIRRNATVVHVLLDEEGNKSMEKLSQFEGSDLKIFPRLCGPNGSGSFFLFANSNNGFQLGSFRK